MGFQKLRSDNKNYTNYRNYKNFDNDKFQENIKTCRFDRNDINTSLAIIAPTLN